MRYLSICSGIGSDHVAWSPLGWECAAFAEIEPHACAVLAERFPHIPNLGDFTKIEASDVGPVDLVCGGTPCQAFSVAGLRGGLDDSRGNLALEYCRLLGRIRPRWFVWENVPGVFSSTAHVSPDPRGPEDDDTRQDPCVYEEHTGSIDASFPPQAVAFEPGIASRDGGHVYEEVRGTIRSEPGDNRMTVLTPDVDMMVRRLTPKECERLQGLPDDHTLVPYRGKPMADGPRYMMVGNGISINTLSWIGQRLALFLKVEAKLKGDQP